MVDNTKGKARQAGKEAVEGLRRGLAQRVADMLQRDPERLSHAYELGLIRKEWIEKPGEGPVSTATPSEVVERYLESSVEQKPSLLASIGLTAIQVLSAGSEDAGHDGMPSCLTVAFTDIEGFTAYTAKNGDEAASKLLADHHRTTGPIVRSRGGRIAKRLGDGLLLTFPEPEAGVLACLELVEARPEPLRVRAGLHRGDVVVTRDDVVGHVVNVAARVTEAAKGGEVLVTTQACEEMGSLSRVSFSKPRKRTFKGVGEPVRVAKATWATPA